ncbi:type III-B CRISPR module RAMP protein Cmr4 [Skermanella sp. TT6]|uniref:Type III-B CRISPR module RAMP protein Cmr4 n=1 Tax=Skermanella cutis TaxID=2775420 RepID=A0ABX7BCQ7_9PROT|nr:type III-B CRISPR module RAMP protein Cmr4 [Skermanella sp. TT6]QQP92189.1 type III-B CRISPR module RAMP protein Cmr4 [Skermanella sp. TT6]
MPEGSLLFLHALSGLHPGSGAALDAIDLPVQRERHTDWPVIPGSSLKGVLRAATRPAEEPRQDWYSVFGPETAEADKHGGALALTDARLLAFPVRSIKGVFAWVTCPAVLHRFRRDAALAGCAAELPGVPTVADHTVLCAAGNLTVDGETAILEEFDFRRAGDPGDWAAALAARVTDDAAVRERMRGYLAILSDDDFTHFARYATEVTARIGLDAETKTVRRGALFYQEVLPTETLFYALALAEGSRNEKLRMTAAEVMAWLAGRSPRIVQIDGDETIGRGLCALRLQGREVRA